MADKPTGLALLRAPFPAHQISKLPKPTKQQTDAVKADFKSGIRCEVCGLWHHPKVVHLDYVGHAALTDRLLDCDPEWNWEPLTFDAGMPAFDRSGGLWIELTVCGVTRLGYGNAERGNNKSEGDIIKEIIGDALRNAAMRFGAALDLWHKGQLHADDDDEPATKPGPTPDARGPSPSDVAIDSLNAADTLDAMAAIWRGLPLSVRALPEVIGTKDNRKIALQAAQATGPIDDQIPY